MEPILDGSQKAPETIPSPSASAKYATVPLVVFTIHHFDVPDSRWRVSLPVWVDGTSRCNDLIPNSSEQAVYFRRACNSDMAGAMKPPSQPETEKTVTYRISRAGRISYME